MTKIAKGDDSTKNIMFFFKYSQDYLLIILYKLSEFKAPSCNGFLRYQVFFEGQKFKKKKNLFFLNFHQVIY